MELNLGRSVPRIIPGLGASNVNATTIWTPQGGYVGSTPVPAYVAPVQVPTPACAFEAPGTSDSQACQDQVMAANKQNIAANTAANLTVDQNTCESNYKENAAAYAALGITPPPNNCMAETYNLVPADTTGGVNILAGNATQYLTSTVPIAPTAYTPGVVAPAGGGSTPGRAVLSFTNLTSGNNAVFNVGDRWQIQIVGAAPNAPVAVVGGLGTSSSTAAMGTTDSTGSFTMNGQMSAAQVGSWTEQWTVGGQSIGTFSFTVNPTNSTSTAATGGSVTGSMADLLSASTTLGGTSIPDWALGLGALEILWFVMRK